jgi:hypothetical protein
MLSRPAKDFAFVEQWEVAEAAPAAMDGKEMRD